MTLEQQNQRIAQLEKILDHPYIKRKIIEYDSPLPLEEMGQAMLKTWNEIFTDYDLPSLRSSKN
jgi:hypothetical protein